MKNSLHQTAFLSTTQSELILPTVGNISVRNPYLISLCIEKTVFTTSSLYLQDAFWCLVQLVEHYMPEYFVPGMVSKDIL